MSTLLPIITIDPGHGGRQPGAVGPTGLREKDVCLAVALRIREILRGRVDIRLTRMSDADLALDRRPAAAGSRAYVSIHCNAHTTATANGTETFWLTGGTAESRRLAEILQRGLIAALGRSDRGVKTANFRVLHQRTVPAALVELAFISNPQEEALLRQAGMQQRAAEAIAESISQFLGVRLRAETVQPAAKNSANRKTHTVVAGDTLWGLTQRYGVTLAQIRHWNNLSRDTIQVGQDLIVS